MSIFFALMVMLVVTVLRLIPKKKTELFHDLESDDFRSSIRAIAIATRRVDAYGVGLSYNALLRPINKAIKIIDQKASKGEQILEFERWIYDNYYELKKSVTKETVAGLIAMPHIGNEPRVMILARFIVNNSEGKLDEERVKEAIKYYQETTELYTEEIDFLPQALLIAIAINIRELSEKVLHYNFMTQQSKKAKFNSSLAISDCYVYNYLKNNNLKKTDSRQVIIRMEQAEATYCQSVDFNNRRAKNAILGLRSMSNLNINNTLYKLSKVYNGLYSFGYLENMQEETIAKILSRANKLATKYNISEKTLLTRIEKLTKSDNIDITTLLFDYPKAIKTGKIKVDKVKLYSPILISVICDILIGVGYGFITKSWFLGLLFSIISYVPISQVISDVFAYKRSLGNAFYIKQNDLTKSQQTLLVKSIFINDMNHLKEEIKELEELYSANKLKFFDLSLLIDTPSSDNEVSTLDREIIKEIEENFVDIRDNINVFLRRKSLINGKFVPFERKRGAIDALVKYLVFDQDTMLFVRNKKVSEYKYMLLIDDDNKLLPHSVINMISCFEHPYNEKYDMLALSPKYNAFSITTKYSKRFMHNAGIERYPMFCDMNYRLYKNANYCGKGLIKIDSYAHKVLGAFKPNTVLSHDIIEGAILSTGLANEVVYEDAPTSVESELTRRERWARGDLLLMRFLGNWRRQDGSRNPSNIGVEYKDTIFKNMLSFYTPLLILTFMLYCVFNYSFFNVFGLVLAIFGLGLYNILTNLRSVSIRRLSCVIKSIILIVLSQIERLLWIPYNSYKCVEITIKIIVKKIFNPSHLLEWKTFRCTQKNSSYFNYVLSLLPSMIIISGISIIVAEWWFLVYSVISIIYTLVVYFEKKPIKFTQSIKASDRAMMLDISKKINNYYNETTKNGLPLDNIQSYPKVKECKKTSPTNIGMTLVSYIAFNKLELLSDEQTISNIEKQISIIEDLEKWKGNLYNWYYTDSRQKINDFVSSVDVGNYIASLMVLRSYLLEKENFSLARRVTNQIENTSIEELYSNEKKLFYIGCSKTNGYTESFYDLYSSESLILTMSAIALGRIDNNAYHNLSRQGIAYKGYTMLSWSGTAFEYMLPHLFFKETDGSLFNKTARNISTKQYNTKFRGLAGVSECAYSTLDSDLNYQYYAFGIRGFAQRNEPMRKIVTPYASFLCMKHNKKFIDNINNMIKQGAYNEYGLYEAIDMQIRQTKFVYSHFAHHQGMIMGSIANLLCEDIIKEYYSRYDGVKSALLLITERNIENRASKQIVYPKLLSTKDTSCYRVKGELSKRVSQYNILVGCNTCLEADERGNTKLACGDFKLGGHELKHSGMKLYIVDEQGVVSSPTLSPLYNDDFYSYRYSDKGIEYSNDTKNIQLEILLPPHIPCCIRSLTINGNGKERKKYKVYFYEELSLCSDEEYESHRVFHNLFVKTSFDGNTINVVKKNPQGEQVKRAFLTVKGMNITPQTNRFKFIGRGRDESNPIILNGNCLYESADIGNVIEPCFGGYGEIEVDSSESVRIDFIELIENDMLALVEMFKQINSTRFFETSKTAIALSKDIINTIGLTQKEYTVMNRLVHLIEEKQIDRIRIENLMQYTNIIDLSYIPLCINYDKEKHENVNSLIKIVKILIKIGHKLPINIIMSEKDSYRNPIINEINQIRGSANIDIRFINKYDYPQDTISEIIKNCYSYEQLLMPNERLSCDHKLLYNSLAHKEQIIGETIGEGVYDKNDNYSIKPYSVATLLPYSNVVGDSKGGYIVTESAGGFIYRKNSENGKITKWYNDPVLDRSSTELFIIIDNNYYLLNSVISNAKVTYAPYKTTYTMTVGDIVIDANMYLVRRGENTLFEIIVRNESSTKRHIDIGITCQLALGKFVNQCYLKNVVDNKIYTINPSTKQKCVLCCSEKSRPITSFDTMNYRYRLSKVLSDYGEIRTDNTIGFVTSAYVEAFNSYVAYYCIGSEIDVMTKKLGELVKSATEWNDTLIVTSSQKYIDMLCNRWLKYQAISSRLMARAGYYQAGGAIGFRDQLQDSMILMFDKPEFIRKHILNCAGHQYVEGDVQHWWHNEKLGVRTRITDDRMFLVYVTCQYIKGTGDISILDEQVPYLQSKPLAKWEKSRMEDPAISQVTGSLLEHLLKAIEITMQFGEYGLLLIGGGDWNDALDEIGDDTKGESIWLTAFSYGCIMALLEYIDNNDSKKKLMNYAKKLYDGVNGKYGYNGIYFNRAITKEGEVLGDKQSNSCRIDLITQATVAMMNASDDERILNALEYAKTLIDTEVGIIKLLSPPFNDSKYYGYISNYPEGVRENGGQYTHAAAWYMYALCKIGNKPLALKLFNMINPVAKCMTTEGTLRYKGEPYVISADVYTNNDNYGRMGWSYYTGSATWLYRVWIEGILGINMVNGSLAFDNTLPMQLDNTIITINKDSKNITITLVIGEELSLMIDNVYYNGNRAVSIEELKDNSQVIVTYRKCGY